MTAAPLGLDLDTVVEEVSRVWLLAPDGSPLDGAQRWDRKLRTDGDMVYANRSLWVQLANGEPGLWQWIADHARTRATGLADPRNVIHPIAVEVWTVHQELGWVRNILPRLNLHDIGKPLDLKRGEWPVWTWEGRPNPQWVDEQFRETVLGQQTCPGRPAEAPPTLTVRELEAL